MKTNPHTDPVLHVKAPMSETALENLPVLCDKRFYAATAAMQGILSCNMRDDAIAVARLAVMQADALLRELEQTSR
jgi:hypothetical protein